MGCRLWFKLPDLPRAVFAEFSYILSATHLLTARNHVSGILASITFPQILTDRQYRTIRHEHTWCEPYIFVRLISLISLMATEVAPQTFP